MSTSTLSAAANDRKARLAQLKSLKRKAPTDSTNDEDVGAPTSPRPSKSPRTSPAPDESSSTSHLLSGRNYDPLTRGPKLGFELNPASTATTATLEARAKELSDAAKAAQAAEKAEQDEGREAPLDLFKLQPKKPNWDLKRELERRLEGVNVRTENAIARLVRERVEGQKKAQGQAAAANGSGRGDAEADEEGKEMGMEGNMLVEATKEREREDEEEARRERVLEAELEAP